MQAYVIIVWLTPQDRRKAPYNHLHVVPPIIHYNIENTDNLSIVLYFNFIQAKNSIYRGLSQSTDMNMYVLIVCIDINILT